MLLQEMDLKYVDSQKGNQDNQSNENKDEPLLGDGRLENTHAENKLI